MISRKSELLKVTPPIISNELKVNPPIRSKDLFSIALSYVEEIILNFMNASENFLWKSSV
jgi:hypothetical protein